MKFFDTNKLNYSINKKAVWIGHILFGIFLISIAVTCLIFMSKDPKDVPFDFNIMNEAIYIILIIFGSFMMTYHGHFLFIDQLG
jgi:hypothetical protein